MLPALTFPPLLALLVARAIGLPGGPPVGMDYLAYDATNARVWVPAGNTGNVDVIDVATGKLTTLGGFATAPARRAGRPPMGPSSATIGEGSVWIGNRGDDQVCAFDARTLGKGPCVQLSSMPDGLAYVAVTHELWITTPQHDTLTIVDVKDKRPGRPVTIALAGAPEGFAVDQARGTFYTNLEDHDQTLAIDVKTRRVTATWPATCGADGPRGLALDVSRRLLFVACTDGARTLDLANNGKSVGRLETGGGVDNIDYLPQKSLLYVASGKDATLVVARVATGGALSSFLTLPTAKGARNAVVDASGTAYVADSAGGQVIVIKPQPLAAPAPPESRDGLRSGGH